MKLSSYIKNRISLHYYKKFMGGDNEDVPVPPKSIKDMVKICDLCFIYKLPQPEVFPWAGGRGIQAEWEYRKLCDYYVEIDSGEQGIEILVCKNQDYNNAIQDNKFSKIEEAFDAVKEYLYMFKGYLVE